MEFRAAKANSIFKGCDQGCFAILKARRYLCQDDVAVPKSGEAFFYRSIWTCLLNGKKPIF